LRKEVFEFLFPAVLRGVCFNSVVVLFVFRGGIGGVPSAFAVVVIDVWIDLEETWGGEAQGSWFAQDITRVDHTEVFGGEPAFVGAICVDGAEGESGEGVSEFGTVWRSVAEGR
jgi:hypothetical protein